MLLFNPYIEICAFVFLLTLTIIFFIKENLHTIQSTFYGVFLILALLILVFDVATAYTISYSALVPRAVNMTLNTIFYFFNIAAPVMYMLFMMVLTDSLQSFRKPLKRIWLAILLLPYAASLALLAVNAKTACVFGFDDVSGYFHGSLYPALLAVAIFYLVVGTLVVFIRRKRVSATQRRVIFFYILLTIASIVVQYRFPTHLVTGAFTALGLVCIYFTFQNPDTYIDTMTGILGRSGFLVAISQSIKWRRKQNCVVIIDINDFKVINNNFGILAGDELIHRVVDYLRSIAPDKRRLFRIGGDHFALLLCHTEADGAIDMIRRRFKYSWAIFENRINVSVSIAKVPILSGVKSGEAMMQLVENSLVLSKEAGGSSYLEVDDSVLRAIRRRAKIENRLRNFAKNGCLRINFQPIFSLSKGRVTSAEVLLRMNDAELGAVSPDEFIRIAERSGMILQVGHFVLSEACRFISENHLWNYGIDFIDLNLSPAECMQENYAHSIKDTISDYPIQKNILNFEITETVAAASADKIQDIISALSRLGVSFSLDDYTQGYSNSNTIINFPFKYVKLDKTLLWSAFENEKANIVYRSTVRMLKEMGMKIIAEGAETAQHAEYLKSLGVDFIQGYYYGRPLSKEDFLSTLTPQNVYYIS